MHFKTFSAAVFGIDAYLVEVEVDVGSGKPGDFNVVGLPDVAVKESRERIKAALKNCGHDFPFQSVTVNLAPADIRKEGSAFDLPMALSILGCQGAFFGKRFDQYVFLEYPGPNHLIRCALNLSAITLPSARSAYIPDGGGIALLSIDPPAGIDRIF